MLLNEFLLLLNFEGVFKMAIVVSPVYIYRANNYWHLEHLRNLIIGATHPTVIVLKPMVITSNAFCKCKLFSFSCFNKMILIFEDIQGGNSC